MIQYQELIRDVLENGALKANERTGVGTIEVFNRTCRYDLREGFPLVTIKKTFYKSIVKELLWFLRGETHTDTLGCGIWDHWSAPGQNDPGEQGPIYGKQWRLWEGPNGETYDQIARAIETLKKNPESRRIIVNAWNVTDLLKMSLTPCHTMFQFLAEKIPGAKEGEPQYFLDLTLVQRSADVLIGVPFNMASYAILQHLIAREVKMIPREFIHTTLATHIYSNHIVQARELLERTPLPLPDLVITDKPLPYPGCPRDGSVLEADDIKITGYQHHPYMKLPIAV